MSLVDIDECFEYSDECNMNEVSGCQNTDGSYTCSCIAGYELAPDKKTCIGNLYNTVFNIKKMKWLS